jgi:pyrroline-5-carboxylate reductase
MQIGFIGAGQMARALAEGFVKRAGIPARDVTAADCSLEARNRFEQAVPGAKVTPDNRVAADSDVVVLALKPQHMASALEELTPIGSDRLVVSIAAGISLDRLCEGLGSHRIVRVMPNTPALVGAGAAAFCRASGATDQDAALVKRLLEAVGRCWELPESLMDAVTALSGSGPAFVFVFIEALCDGAVHMGLPRAVALQLAAQTVLGSAQMVISGDDHTAQLKDRVASPGGTTIAGLHVLERGAFRGLVMSAIEAATKRSQELGR